jgi:GNAT superfamily N-acetyltransferase
MWLRVPRSQFTRQKGARNKSALKALVSKREDIGILAYIGDKPVGWCAVAPRKSYRALERSRILKRIDNEPVWSVTCLFVAKPFRRRGITVQLLKAAVQHVRQRGGKILEGYPVEPKQDRVPDAFAWHGLASAFRQAGFGERLRRSETRPIMRYEIKRA